MVQQPSGRLDKSYFEHNNTDLPMLELFSLFSKEEKKIPMNPTRSSKGSKASAGKYSDPWAREFQLDLNKVGTAHRVEEEIRNRQLHAEPDLKPEAKQNQAKTENVSSRLTNFYKVINFMLQE